MLKNVSVLDLVGLFTLANLFGAMIAILVMVWFDMEWSEHERRYKVWEFLFRLTVRCAVLGMVAFSTLVAVAMWYDYGWSWFAGVPMLVVEATLLYLLAQVLLNVRGVQRMLFLLFGCYD